MATTMATTRRRATVAAILPPALLAVAIGAIGPALAAPSVANSDRGFVPGIVVPPAESGASS
jgi:hypothetical protein